MKKAIVVINGKGGIGKDTLIKSIEQGKNCRVHNTSSIDLVRDMCEPVTALSSKAEKDLAYRQMLADIKHAVDRYYRQKHGVGLTTKEMISEVFEGWLEDDLEKIEGYTSSVIFIHIREPENIKEFLAEAKKELKKRGINDVILTTLLIRSERGLDSYGNSSDDRVENFEYEHIYESKNGINEDAECFRKMFFSEIMEMGEDNMYPETKLTLTYEDLKNMLDAMHDDGLFAEGDGCNLHLSVEDEIDKAIKDGTITVHDKEHEI